MEGIEFLNKNKNQEDSIDARKLISDLCSQFYELGWVSGTGGGISVRQDNRLYVAPSGVQKERIKPCDMFVLDENTLELLEGPKNKKLKCSECFPLFHIIYKERGAGAIIHNHSIFANLVTSLVGKYRKYSFEQNGQNSQNENGQNGNGNCINKLKYFEISNQEMIKGIKRGSTNETFKYNDILRVPIIENTLYEKDLAHNLKIAIDSNPETNAVLVRNHGVYVWGKTWESAKTMAECYDYLFRLKCESHRLGIEL